MRSAETAGLVSIFVSYGVDGPQAGRGAQAEDQGEDKGEAGVSHGMASWSKDVKMIYTPAGADPVKAFFAGPKRDQVFAASGENWRLRRPGPSLAR